GGRRPGRKHPLDPRRHRHGAPGAVNYGRGLRAARRQQRSAQPGQQRAPAERRHLPIITSEALTTAQASSPFWRARSATASLVIEDVTMTLPPISTRTWEVVAPLTTSTIFP